MTEVRPGDRVAVSQEAHTVVTCDHIDAIAGKTGHVRTVYEKDNEAFVVANPDDEEGSYIPLNLLQRID